MAKRIAVPKPVRPTKTPKLPPPPANLESESHSYDHNRPVNKVVSRYSKSSK